MASRSLLLSITLIRNALSRSSTGVRLVLDNGVFDVDETGDERVDEDVDDDDEHSPPLLVQPSSIAPPTVPLTVVQVMVDAAPDGIAAVVGALNTSSSSSISESELCVAETGAIGGRMPAARRFCSSSSSCPIKFRFGEMMGRASLTIL